MKKFFISLREHTTNVINFEKKKMLLLTEKIKNQDTTACYICEKRFPKKLETIAILQVNMEVQHIIYVI